MNTISTKIKISLTSGMTRLAQKEGLQAVICGPVESIPNMVHLEIDIKDGFSLFKAGFRCGIQEGRRIERATRANAGKLVSIFQPLKKERRRAA